MSEEMKKMKVYVVDDDPAYLASIMEFLRWQFPEAELRPFPTGESCIHEVNEHPDVVILDYFLNARVPDAWDGAKVMEKINWASPYTSVIMLTGRGSVDIAVDSMKRGAVNYIVKDENAFLKIKDFLTTMNEYVQERDRETKKEQRRMAAIRMAGILLLAVFLALLVIKHYK